MPGFGVQAGGRAVAVCEAFITKRDEGCMARRIKIHRGGSLRSYLNDHKSYAAIYWYTMSTTIFFPALKGFFFVFHHKSQNRLVYFRYFTFLHYL